MSLFQIPFLAFSISHASFHFLCYHLFSLHIIFTSSHATECSLSCACFANAEFSVLVNRTHLWCSFFRVPKARPVSPIYSTSQSLHGMEYTIPVYFRFSSASLGFMRHSFQVDKGFMDTYCTVHSICCVSPKLVLIFLWCLEYQGGLLDHHYLLLLLVVILYRFVNFSIVNSILTKIKAPFNHFTLTIDK